MAGPGGRSGGFRGGSSGGGFGGGSGFRGSGGFSSRPSGSSYYRPVRPIFVGGFGPRYHRGGGCGCSGLFLVPLILIILFAFLIAFSTGSGEREITSGGKTLIYDEERFQNYADEVYNDAFGGDAGYENNLLLVVLTNDEADDYFAIAWVGDNIHTSINAMMGGDSELGYAMDACINYDYYAYSLDSDLAAVVEMLEADILALGLPSSLKDPGEISGGEYAFENKTDLDLTEETVEAALASFQESTAIPMVIHVAEMEDVFRTKFALGSIFNSGAIPIVLVVVVVVIALAVRKRSNKATEE